MSEGRETGPCDQLQSLCKSFRSGRGPHAECEGLSCSVHPLSYFFPPPFFRQTSGIRLVNQSRVPDLQKQLLVLLLLRLLQRIAGLYPRPDLLDLLGVFVADKDDDGVDVDAVEPLDGVRRDVQQTVAALRADKEGFFFFLGVWRSTETRLMSNVTTRTFSVISLMEATVVTSKWPLLRL